MNESKGLIYRLGQLGALLLDRRDKQFRLTVAGMRFFGHAQIQFLQSMDTLIGLLNRVPELADLGLERVQHRLQILFALAFEGCRFFVENAVGQILEVFLEPAFSRNKLLQLFGGGRFSVVDAVSHLGIRHLDMPLTPARIWAAIQAKTH